MDVSSCQVPCLIHTNLWFCRCVEIALVVEQGGEAGAEVGGDEEGIRRHQRSSSDYTSFLSLWK